MKKIIMATVIAAATLSSCTKAPKALVLYYSQEGTTKAVAEEIASLTGADLCSIELENPYSGTYDETIARSSEERANGVLPALKPLSADIADYDVIYLGYPVWFGTYAPPIAALVAENDFAGKKIITFCSFGSGGLEACAADLSKALPNAEVITGYGVRAARKAAIKDEVKDFLLSAGLIEGEYTAPAAYSEMKPVTEAEAAIFHAACDGYQFPLGNPVACGSREKCCCSTEYVFSIDNGSTIYVLAPKDGTPEFTRVVR